MPRISKKSEALNDIEFYAQVVAGCIALSRSQEKKIWWKQIQLLIHVHAIIAEHRYLSRSDYAGRHTGDILDNIIHEFSEDRFKNLWKK